MANLTDKTSAYIEARKRYEELKKISNDAHEEYKRAEYSLVDAMVEDCSAGYKLEDGTNFTLRPSVSCSATQENDSRIREWLLETEGDDLSYVEERVSKKALLELLRKKVDEEHIPADEFPEFMKVSTRPALYVYGWEKVKNEGMKK